MITLQAASVLSARCRLGEGPVWYGDELWFVDIEGLVLHRFNPVNHDHRTYHAGQRIGFAVPCTNKAWVIGLEDALALWRPERGGAPEVLHRPATQPPGVRFNDGKVAPNGTLYAGTMGLQAERDLGALYRFDTYGTSHVLVRDVTISNGLAWNTQLGHMYYIDTATQCIDVFDWDSETDAISNRRPLYTFRENDGRPDGMCIDSAGRLWVAMWAGACVLGIDPDTADCVGRIDVPTPNVTSCCFGGPDLCDLYITSSNRDSPTETAHALSFAGDLFHTHMDLPGLPVTPVRRNYGFNKRVGDDDCL